jgi:uncharacterized lipoprotein YddW (UPF0748 family)
MWKLTCLFLIPALFGFAREEHVLWVHPPDAGGTSLAGVKQFVERSHAAHIDRIVLVVKGMSGELYFPSRKFPQSVVKGYDSFDLLDAIVREAHARAIKVEAWLCDFVEGENGAAVREHPDWVQLNPDGKPTNSERLGATRPYPYVWMCPARRPGYADQWLLPLYEEIASRYAVDGVHNDYVRFPGDVGPDSYCFCDYCLKGIPHWALLRYEGGAGERFRVNTVQSRIEANWWTDPTMLPVAWDLMDRRERADYLLNGRTIPGGPPDMRYFFYEYRVEAIKRWVRELHDRMRSINPKLEISAAVFKNPIQSGRFLGQKWDDWTDWMDILMPMTYRSHFAGSFEAYLDNLTETTARQIEWVRHRKPVYAGIATTYLYREELKPFDDFEQAAGDWKASRGSREQNVQALASSFEQIRTRLAPLAPERARLLEGRLKAAGSNPSSVEGVAADIRVVRNDPPLGFFPPEKLTRAIAAARRGSPDGIAVFAAGSLTREKLWSALTEAFRSH